MHKLSLLLALLAATMAISCGHAAASAVRMHLTHTDAGRGLSPHQLLQRMALRSKARAARILAGAASAQVTPGEITDGVPDTEYLVHLAIGTPPQLVQLTLDTGSDLVWTQCQPCTYCFNQTLPYFNASLSSTFVGELPCSSAACQDLPISSCGTDSSSLGNQTCGYTYSYGDGSVTTGILDADTFTFGDAAAAAGAGGGGSTTVPALAFGCGLNNTGIFKSNETGIAGFARGALSLPSQLKVDNFSYCFTDIRGSTPSPVLLGLPANLYSGASGAVKTTPLIQSSANPSFYYLSLKSITVGSKRLPVPESAFALKNNGTGGTIIDSGTSVTSLPPLAYGLLHDAFVSQVNLPVTGDGPLCFAVSSSGKKEKVPKLELEFEGATLELPRENYVFEMEEGGQNSMCIAIMSSGGDMTTIGNYQQQNLHVLYDLAGNKLSFVPADCDNV